MARVVSGPEMYWPEADDAVLAKLWAEGVTSAAIGLELRRSKSAILGRARRLGLTPRANPAVRKPGSKARDRSAAGRSQARNLGGRGAVEIAKLRHPLVRALAVAARQPQAVAAREPQAKVVVRRGPPSKPTPPQSCQWPHGEPRTPQFRFCGERAEPGRPYCAQCCKRAYVFIHRQHREDSYAA